MLLHGILQWDICVYIRLILAVQGNNPEISGDYHDKDLNLIHARSVAGLVVLVPIVAMSPGKMWPLGPLLQG